MIQSSLFLNELYSLSVVKASQTTIGTNYLEEFGCLARPVHSASPIRFGLPFRRLVAHLVIEKTKLHFPGCLGGHCGAFVWQLCHVGPAVDIEHDAADVARR
jgi:hypothetical protein